MATYDLLLKNGRVIDPVQGLDGVMDVALLGGRVAAVAAGLPADAAAHVIDVAGKLVVPGLVDLHTHVFPGVTSLGIEADRDCLFKGATTVVDAGSAGALNIDGFRRYVIRMSQARVLAFLNISTIGMLSDDVWVTELGWLPLCDVPAAIRAIRSNRDIIVGLKVRLSEYITKENGPAVLERALQVAEAAGVRMMVHIGASPMPLADILRRMRPGDILTHTYTSFGGIDFHEDGSYAARPPAPRGAGTTILDAAGRVIPEAWDARRRGVVIDVGHGMGSFSFEVCRAAFEQGYRPDTISTDLHTGSINGPVFDLPTLMSRFLCLGMPLTEVIAATTARPAQALGLAGEIGSLRPGVAGDVTVLELVRGHFEFRDAAGASMEGDQKLLPALVVRAGRLVF